MKASRIFESGQPARPLRYFAASTSQAPILQDRPSFPGELITDHAYSAAVNNVLIRF